MVILPVLDDPPPKADLNEPGFDPKEDIEALRFWPPDDVSEKLEPLKESSKSDKSTFLCKL
jgi:hypothetical protein